MTLPNEKASRTPAATGVGRRGPKGDHGEMGETGGAGEQGMPGGLGATGERGERGRRGASLSAMQVLVLFVSVVAVSVLLAFRSETNANNIKANTRSIAIAQYETCVASTAIYSRINDADTALADIERTQITNPTLAQKRIDAYLSARVLPLPTCGVRPR
jgi:hypothetical protein